MSHIKRFVGPSLAFVLAGACATDEPLYGEGAIIPAAEESTAVSTQALSSCGWGGGDYVRTGFFNSGARLDVVSPEAGIVQSYYGGMPFLYAPRPVANAWGGSGYTWAADFTGDGLTDLASANGGSVYMKLASGAGTGAFVSATWLVPNSWGGAGYTFAADFSGDGRADIASAISGVINYHRAQAGGGFLSSAVAVANAWGGAGYTFAADFSGDGRADIASASGGNVYMKLSTGASFASSAWPVANTWGGSGYTFAADFTGDGRADIASADAGRVYIKRSNGASFTSLTWPVANAWGGSSYTWAADFNGDGRTDIASANGKDRKSVV